MKTSLPRLLSACIFLLLSLSTFSQTVPATALKFDPSLTVDDNSRLNYVSVNDPFEAYQKEMTVEFWMYTPNANLPFGSVMGQADNNSSNNTVWLMHPNRNGTMTFYVNDAGTLQTATGSITANSWHHYAAVASATSTKFYVDGVLVHTGAGISNTILVSSTSVIHIGKDVRFATRHIANNDPDNRYATMILDELRIWNRALCSEEINANKDVEINPTGQNGLQQYYRFNQGFANANNASVNILNDLSGNNRNGTLNNFTLNGTESNWVTSGSTNTGTVSAFVAPTAPITGNTSMGLGTTTTLSNTITGGSWTSSNMAVATINANTGFVNALSTGTSTITYTTACGGVSSATLTVSSPATALKTDGVNDHVTINNPFREFGKAITVEFWMNAPSAIMPYGSVMGQSTAGSDNMSTNVWLMHPNTTGGIDFLVNDAGTWRGVTVPIRAGGWHHYVGVASEFGTKFYVDGVQVGNTGPGISTGILNNLNSIIHIGKDPRHNTGRFGNIYIDEVRIWSRVLCAEEINNSRNCELNLTGQTGLQEYYRFNQGFVGANNSTETTLTDLSGNNRHGTLSGFALTGNNSNWVQSGFVSTANCSPYIAPISPITGNTSLCIGSNTTLANATAGGLWSSSNTAVAIVNANTGVVTGVSAGAATITYRTECGGVANTTVTIGDAVKPVITCPGNQTLNLDASCKATLPDYRNLVTVSDNCTATGSLVITQSPAAGTVVNDKGALIVTFTVTDASGNSSECTISVDKKDVTAPVITCPALIVVDNTANSCGAVVDYINPKATDNCTGGAFNFFSTNEPNNYNGLPEDYIQLYTNGTWNDLPNSSQNRFIVEFNSVISTVFSNYTLIGTFGGHTYYISSGTSTWTGARTAAQSIGGDLASINTLGESTFLAPYGGNTWVGGYQDRNDPEYREPGNALQNFAGWKWVDGTKLGAGQIVIKQTAGLPAGSVFPIGETTNTFEAIDESGNRSTCSFIVMVKASEIILNGNDAEIVSGDLTPSTTDHTDFGGTVPGTPISRNYRISNTGTAPLSISSIAVSNTSFTRSGITLPITINPGESVSFTLSFNSVTVGSQTATVTINNDDCNEAAYSFGVKAEITCTNPVFSNINIYLQASTSANSCNAVVNYPLSVSGVPAPDVTYTFTGATTGSGSGTGSGKVFNKGVTNVVVSATNACTTITTSFDVTVVDDVKPVVATKNFTAYLNASGQTTITPADVNNGSSDNCGPVTLSLLNTGTICATAVEGSNLTLQAPAGAVITSITFASYGTPNGNCGNFTIGSCNATNSKAIVESLALNKNSVTIAANNSVFGDPCFGTAKRLYVSATYSGGSTVNTFDCSKVGNNTVTLIATDVNGNSNSGTAVVTVVDNLKPTVVTRNITVQLDQNGTASITPAQINNGSTDNCSIASVQLDKTSFSCENRGQNTVILKVVDVNGNEATGTAIVTVEDNILPTITAPSNISQFTDAGLCSATVNLGTPVTADNCGVAFVGNNAPASFSVGTTTVTWTVKDAAGNTSTATQTVTVTDKEKPVITAPANVQGNNTPGLCTGTVTLGSPVTADNCGVANADSDAPAIFPVGTTTVTWTVIDIHGNKANATQTVTIIDNENPTITAPANVQGNNTPGLCTGTVTLGSPVTADNCGVANVDSDAPATFPVGTTTVTWTVIDIHGNKAAAEQTVTITDNEKPTIATTGINSNNDAGKCNAAINVVPPTVSDNCSIASVTGIRNDAQSLTDVYPVGTTTITWTVTDIHNNTNSTVQTIVVTDNEQPVLACATNQVFCANTGGNTQYTIPVLNQSDNCGIAGTTYTVTGATNRNGTGTDASGSFAIGTSTVTFTVTDIHGNVSTCSFTVIINPLPVAGINIQSPDVFCNQFTLTGTSTLNGPFGYQWLYNNSPKSAAQQLSLGLTDADGIYTLFVTDGNGCRSEFGATYNYQKQNLSSSYTLLAKKEVTLGHYNTVASGSVGIMTSKGEAEFKKYTTVNGAGAFVKAPKIDTDKGSIINSKVYGVATVTLPTMQYNTSSTRYLRDIRVNQNTTVTLTGNYDDVTIKKGANATLTGSIFGKVRLEEGASVKFTSAVVYMEELKVDRGPKSGGYSYVRFNQSTSVRLNGKVSIGNDVIVNPEAYVVTFYMGDKCEDGENFHVKGDDTRVTANIYIPNGKIKVTGGNYGHDDDDDNDKGRHRCDHRSHSSKDCKHRGHGHQNCDHRSHSDRDCKDEVYMTGLFIAEEIESEGKYVIWNSYSCGSASVPTTVVTSSAAVTTLTDEFVKKPSLPTTEEELKVKVMPNPTSTYFTLKLESKYDAPVTLKVIDISGRIIDGRAKLASNSTVEIGHNYHAGSYFAEFIQGNRRKVVQLMKIKK